MQLRRSGGQARPPSRSHEAPRDRGSREAPPPARRDVGVRSASVPSILSGIQGSKRHQSVRQAGSVVVFGEASLRRWGRACRERDTAAARGHLSRAVGVARVKGREPTARFNTTRVYIYATHCQCPGCSFHSASTGPIQSETLPATRSSQHRRRERSITRRSLSCHRGLLVGAATDGERPGTVLRQGRAEQGLVDAGGGHAAHRLHSEVRPRKLALSAQASRFAAVREELPAAVDQLPPAGPQARQFHRRGGRDHHKAARHARQQVVQDCGVPAGQDGQRDQERLEHALEEAGGAVRGAGAQRRRRQEEEEEIRIRRRGQGPVSVDGLIHDDDDQLLQRRLRRRAAEQREQGARRGGPEEPRDPHARHGLRLRHAGGPRAGAVLPVRVRADVALRVVDVPTGARPRRGPPARAAGDGHRPGAVGHHRRRRLVQQNHGALPRQCDRGQRRHDQPRGGKGVVVGEPGEGVGPVGPHGGLPIPDRPTGSRLPGPTSCHGAGPSDLLLPSWPHRCHAPGTRAYK